ncbi:trypsin-like peptidase domain-containing protein [Streptomyces filamentosus]|uniref:Trypsin-like peptidase domain-containing protein n=2 Tax=Streptomyces TaxID=1883 RepID=A0ABY4USA1_STRFL|nr:MULTISPECIES: trypsin-like peptidase domain-containing protein [Streptomyces]MYR81335.1 PDZ domain-containing protein [Streptomyces sp. SID5466]USC47194.1 trypsin-like peptidase domain-containing protein [Streptomyces filamentosus]
MDDGKPTGPQAKWWSRPMARRADRPEPDSGPAPAATPKPEGPTAPDRAAAPGPAPASAPEVRDAPPAAEDQAFSLAPAAPDEASSPAPAVQDQVPAAPDQAVPRPRPAGQPLHEPDEYGTPPYGGPGPWAPAPPVQRPTPAHGTVVPPGAGGPSPQYAATNGAGIPAPAPAPTDGHTPPHPQPAGGFAAPQPAPADAFAPPHPAPADAFSPPPQQPQAHANAPHAAAAHEQQQPGHPGHGQQHLPTQWLQYDPWGAPGQPLTRPGPPEGAEPGRKKKRRGGAFAGVLLLALVASGIGGGVGAYIERNGGLTTVELPQAGRDNGDRAPDSVAGIAASALPSVVTLHVSGTAESGTGTGFVLDGQGHILTNNHVVAPAGSSGDITVTFSTGETASAELVGKDSGYDLAVVRVRGVSGLKPLPLGNSDNVQVGDPVVAIGAPFDLSNTVTSGIISAKQRPITAGGEKGDGSDISYVDALQTDAPINPGNSGGPLVDSRAHVIGINSAIRAADSGRGPESGGQSGSIGLGFAIPINQGKRVAEELISTGKATHPVIGVTLDMKYTGDGAKVGTKGADGGPAVAKDGPADKAGIKSGDVITQVEGQRVHSGEELIVKIRAHRPGDDLDLKLTRGGKERTVTLKLGSASGT